MYLFVQFLQGGIFSSCKKETQQTVKSYEIAHDYSNLNEEIKAFKTNMTHSYKSGEVMKFNDAIWMMEACFNYYHSFVGLDFISTKTDTLIIPVNYNGFDQVATSELSVIYKQVNNAIVESFENYEGVNKKPFLFDMELQGTENGSQIQILATNGSLNSEKRTKQVDKINPFGIDDYWYPGNDESSYEIGIPMGKCGNFSGDEYGERSALIELKIATHKYIRLQFNSMAYYFANVETVPIPITPIDYPGKVFQGSYNDCLSPENMNYYFHGLQYIIEDLRPVDKTYVTITGNVGYVLGSSIYHSWENPQYGVKTVREQLPEEPRPY